MTEFIRIVGADGETIFEIYSDGYLVATGLR